MSLRTFIVTTAGEQLIAKLLASKTLIITKVEVGRGELPAGADTSYLKAMSSLINPAALATSTDPVVKDGSMSFTVQYRNDLNGGLTFDFLLREFGVYANDPDNGEILMYYGTLGDYPQPVQAYNGVAPEIREFPVSVYVGSEVNVSLAYNPEAFLSVEDVRSIADGKEPIISTSSSARFWNGLKQWVEFASTARGVVLTGLSTATNAVVAATDSILTAIGKLQAQITGHKGDTSNPHGVTKTQIGLGSVDNTSDANKPISTATQAALDGMMPKSVYDADGDGVIDENALPAAAAGKAGIVQLTNNATSTSLTTAPTSAALKLVYDLAAEANAPTYIYKCTGSADSTAIANIVNNFFNNGTAMNMKLIITGTMGVAFTGTYYAMYINATNTRGAVCYLDFSDCYIPTIITAARDFLCVSGSTTRLDVSGLVVTTTRYGVRFVNASNNSFSNCVITSSGSNGVYFAGASGNNFSKCVITATASAGAVFSDTVAGITAFTACKIIGSSYGVYAETANTGAIVTLNGCSISGIAGVHDVFQVTGASTMSWHIAGCIFTGSSVYVNGAAMSAASAAANAYLYMPAYANKFSRSIS